MKNKAMVNDMSTRNKKLVPGFLERIKDAFIDGYEKGKTEAKDKIVSNLQQNETDSILAKMEVFEKNILDSKNKNLETQIKILQSKIDVFIASERDRQELIIHLMTIVEEMMHSLILAGIIPENELQKKNNNNLTYTDDDSDYKKHSLN